MAFGRLEQRSGPQPMSDINMTPLIDVMLVLLVIFMLTAPLMSSSLKLDLPAADGATPASNAPQVLEVSLQANGALYLGEQRLEPPAFAARLAEITAQTAGQPPASRPEVQLRADQAVPYGLVAALIGQLQQAGLNRIAFVTAAAGPASAPR